MLSLLLMALLQTNDQKVDVENTKVLIFDSAKGLTFRVLNDGKVELALKEEDKETGKKATKTYAAATADEFRRKYPDLVKKHDLDKHLGGKPKANTSEREFEEWWEKLKKGMPGLGPMPGLDQPQDEELRKFMEEQGELLEKLRRPLRAPGPETPPRQAPVPPGGRELGIRVETVSETLRDQLSLKENEGVLVAEVKPGSLAERSGLKEHDILLKLEGKTITDRWQFRAEVLAAMGKPEFGIEVLRAGKREAVKVKTSARKDE
jgi:hypothetical protein